MKTPKRAEAGVLRWGVLGVIALRALTLRPAILDDDEAWFAVNGYSMKNPQDAFRAVLDNKPPGTAWFYWALSRVTGPEHLAQWARLAQGAGLVAAAWVFARVVPGITPARRVSFTWQFTALLLIASGATGPKLFAVTNESLMCVATLLALALAFTACRSGTRPTLARLGLSLLSGAALASAVLIKQTGVFFLLPWLIALGAAPAASLAGITGFVCALSSAVALVGTHLLWQWTYVYPYSVLFHLRQKLFSEWQSGLAHLAIFALVLMPLVAQLARYRDAERSAAPKSSPGFPHSVAWAWLGASLVAIGIGRGLFQHYFLLAVPPLAWLSLRRTTLRPRAWSWIAAFYVFSSFVAFWPSAGVFWGNDLAYYERLSERVQTLLGHDRDARIFVWGGNVLPLALTGLRSVEGFPSARFAAPPYATSASQADFEAAFAAVKPALVLDLHARGDNQFNIPISASPWLSRTLARDYALWADPSLPWARFYLRTDRIPPLFPQRGEFCQGTPSGQPDGMALLQKLKQRLLSPSRRSPGDWALWDAFFRASFNWQWLVAACAPPLPKLRVPSLHETEINPAELAAFSRTVELIFAERNYTLPFSNELPLWWASIAVVEMQPVVLPRAHRSSE